MGIYCRKVNTYATRRGYASNFAILSLSSSYPLTLLIANVSYGTWMIL